jgi:hypothetical protein
MASRESSTPGAATLINAGLDEVDSRPWLCTALQGPCASQMSFDISSCCWLAGARHPERRFSVPGRLYQAEGESADLQAGPLKLRGLWRKRMLLV